MANHKSSEKRVRQTEKKTLRNRVKVSESRTYIKALRNAIEAKNKDEAQKLFSVVQKSLGKLAQKGIIKKNNLARRTSRLHQQIAKI